MLLNLSEFSSETLQQQLVRQIRAQVLAGDLPEGTQLPSIRALAREQKVSVITVQRAYEEIERSGLIQARRGKGFFVARLSDEQKERISLVRLEAKLAPILRQALAEGLSEEEIGDLVRSILKGVPA